jgi:hypothetical protein|tara:strand:- start:276 stop:671 length:396 start_codon:yes stop_codon:yes gene_type:complete
MSKFFVNKETYKERLDICKGCTEYFKPSGNCKVCGCFMRIKASISVMECPKQYWLATQEYEAPEEIPTHLKKEIKEVWGLIEHGQVKDIKTKQRLIELYNTINDTTYSVKTNCSSCLNSIYKFMQDIIKKI